jgi:soluble lytic murein transglycosylase-like protein
VACIISVESRGNPSAHNPSGASGLGQFLPATWRTTPQGQAGLSVYNPDANRAAITWMVAVGRAREFDAVRFGPC